MILSLLNCRISRIIQLTKIHHCTTEMIGQLKEVSSKQENAKRMTIFSGGSKYPPFYVHSALPSREAKVAGKKNDCVTCEHDTDRTQQKSRDWFVHWEWKFIQNGGQAKEWEDLGTRSWDLVKNKQNGGRGKLKEAKNMNECTYKPQECGRMI